ncbi:MAG: thioredoxin family protein [Gammaproteobacteria bacterium]|nr:thioredoxin family protein [Gammaproteobacteria bacterium]
MFASVCGMANPVPGYLNRVVVGLLSACLLAMLFGMAVARADTRIRDPMEHFFNQSFADLPDEVAQSKKEGRFGIMLMFGNDDCPWCSKMKATIFNQVPVQDYFRKHFRIIEIDTEGDTSMVDFDGKEMSQKDFAFRVHRVRATPVFKFFDLNGKELVKHLGTAKTPEEFIWLGEFVVDGHYKSGRFNVYKREKTKAQQQ